MGSYRVFETDRGPLSSRPRKSPDPDDWHRFDLPDVSTLYTATMRQGAYAEALADLRPRIRELAELAAAVFDDVPAGTNPVADEWCERGYMIPGNIPRIWWYSRGVAVLTVDRPGWMIDADHPATHQVLRQVLARQLYEHGLTDLDTSVMRGNLRALTCAAGEWLSVQVLDDGSYPLGVRYCSRLGPDWECWALWPVGDPHCVEHAAIDKNTDQDLHAVTDLFGLRLH